MSFYLYRYDGGTYAPALSTPLVRPYSLWGMGGIVAERRRKNPPGAWEIDESEIVATLIDRLKAAGLFRESVKNAAVIDELVPKGPERRIGRLTKVHGYLGRDGFNPVLLTFEQVWVEIPPDGTPKREEPFPPLTFQPLRRPERLRSFNYFYDGWKTSGSFRGALLWDKHWEHFRDLIPPKPIWGQDGVMGTVL